MGSSAPSVGMLVASKYRLIERLGGGGMGEVFRAEHMLAGRIVALKLLRQDFAENADLTRRFFQEAQAANKIRHPNIVDVLDAGFSESGPYVVMECLDGASLAVALGRAGRLDTTTAVAVVLPMLDALGAAHREGIVHRDLKPENVFLSVTGREVKVKLLDFGIAKVLSSTPEMAPRTNTGTVFGTPDYLSPEQATGEPNLDGRSDLFSVGTVLFELLTGRRPFEAPNAVATAYRIVNVPAPPVAELGVLVDARLQRVLDTALAKRASDRFGSAAAFADALAPFAADGASRREALRVLVDTGVALQPTMEAPRLAHGGASVSASGPAASLSFEPSLPAPIPLKDALPPSDGWAVPLAPPSALAAAIAPTLASNEYARGAPSPRPIASGTGPRARARSQPEWPPLERTSRASRPDLSERASRPDLSERASRPDASEWASRPDSSERASRPDLSGRTTREPVASSSSSYRSSVATSTPVSGALSGGHSLRSAWNIKALPGDASRCHVRGTLPRMAAAWASRAHGKPALEEVLAPLPPDLAESYRNDAFNALVWYDLAVLHVFLEAATSSLMYGDASLWRHLARDNFEHDLAAIFRPPTTRSDPAGMISRFATNVPRVMDFGAVHVVDTGATRVSLRIAGLECATAALRHILAGAIEGMLAGTPGLVIRTPHGTATFAPELEIDVTWRDHH